MSMHQGAVFGVVSTIAVEARPLLPNSEQSEGVFEANVQVETQRFRAAAFNKSAVTAVSVAECDSCRDESAT